jgi:hypothetical protein
MPSIVIKAPHDKVFEAMIDLTRHASWAKHDIVITGDQEGFFAVGKSLFI